MRAVEAGDSEVQGQPWLNSKFEILSTKNKFKKVNFPKFSPACVVFDCGHPSEYEAVHPHSCFAFPWWPVAPSALPCTY